MGHEGTDDEPDSHGLVIKPRFGSVPRIRGLPIEIAGFSPVMVPVRMSSNTIKVGWTWRMRRVTLPMLALASEASDRVPRFSRLRLADSVRFVRFNMARPSLPPLGRYRDARGKSVPSGGP